MAVGVAVLRVQYWSWPGYTLELDLVRKVALDVILY